MATAQQVDDLLASVGAVNQVMANLAAERGKLQGYRDARQQYADLATTQKTVVDTLVAASEAALRDIHDKIQVVFP